MKDVYRNIGVLKVCSGLCQIPNSLNISGSRTGPDCDHYPNNHGRSSCFTGFRGAGIGFRILPTLCLNYVHQQPYILNVLMQLIGTLKGRFEEVFLEVGRRDTGTPLSSPTGSQESNLQTKSRGSKLREPSE